MPVYGGRYGWNTYCNKIITNAIAVQDNLCLQAYRVKKRIARSRDVRAQAQGLPCTTPSWSDRASHLLLAVHPRGTEKLTVPEARAG